MLLDNDRVHGNDWRKQKGELSLMKKRRRKETEKRGTHGILTLGLQAVRNQRHAKEGGTGERITGKRLKRLRKKVFGRGTKRGKILAGV